MIDMEPAMQVGCSLCGKSQPLLQHVIDEGSGTYHLPDGWKHLVINGEILKFVCEGCLDRLH